MPVLVPQIPPPYDKMAASYLELELLFGRPEDLQPISELLVEKYHLQPERLSKYARALELELGRPVDMTGKDVE